MATGTNHYKLGLFVLLGMGLALAFVVTLGASNWNEASVRYDSYFDESVQGLEVGSPVKFRGVSVGRVAAIDIAPDQRHVQVTSELAVPDLARYNLGGGGESALAVHPALRAQLAQAGLTGVKFVLIDYFDGAELPAAELPFPVSGNVIPAVPSTLKGLESSMTRTADQVPQIAGELLEILARMNALLGELEAARLPQQTGELLGQASRVLGSLEREVGGLEAARLSRSLRQSLASFDATNARLEGLITRLDGQGGVLASAERTLGLVGEMARGSSSLGPEVESTLREVQTAARSLRRFSEALERDPDMLLKGRAER